jgi:protein-S-isoprenylcysteine O-methyltransferase Ste14
MLFRSGNWGEHLREASMLLLGVALLGQALGAAASSRHLLSQYVIGPPLYGWPGLAVVAAGVLLMVAAQLHLGASWRVGIDRDARPGLVTAGIYAWSRNPIYLAVFLLLAGFALMVPTWFSIALAVAAPIGFRRQAIYEEQYLRRTYGEAFERYGRGVGRFLPGLGRIS